MRSLLALLPVVVLLTGGCSSDPQDAYCRVVEEQQARLTDIAASDDTGALFDALGVYDDLAAQAPRDIADDWADVIEPLRNLRQVLVDNGVDPSSYPAQEPPADVPRSVRDEIRAAARAVGSQRTVEAMAAVEQQALDVCGTPLSR